MIGIPSLVRNRFPHSDALLSSATFIEHELLDAATRNLHEAGHGSGVVHAVQSAAPMPESIGYKTIYIVFSPMRRTARIYLILLVGAD